MKKLDFEISVNSSNIRLWMGSLGFLFCLIVLIMTVIFGYNGDDKHIDLTKTFLFISGGLLGLNVIKEGINLNVGSSKKEESHTISHDLDNCMDKRKAGICMGQKEGRIVKYSDNDKVT